MPSSHRTLFALVCLGLFSLAAPAIASAGSLTAYRCQMLFKGDAAGPFETAAKPEPSWLGSAFTGGLKERKAVVEFNKTLTEDRETLAKARDKESAAAMALSVSPRSSITHPALQRRFNEVAAAASDDIKGAKSLQQIKLYAQAIAAAEKEIATDDLELRRILGETSRKSNALWSEIPRSASEVTLRRVVNTMRPQLEQLTEPTLLQAAADAMIEKLRYEIEALKAETARRRKAELRFDILDSSNNQQLADDFMRVQSPFINPELEGRIDRIILVKAIAKSPALKRLVYHELQFYRRASMSEQLRTDVATALRAQNTVAILVKALNLPPADREAFAATNAGLRKGVRVLARVRNFSKAVPRNSLKPFSPLLREKILSDALSSPQLVTTIMGSVVVLPALPFKPTVKPLKPVKPVRPDFNYMGKSQKKYARADYKSAKERYERAKRTYAAEMTKFQTEKAIYAAAVTKSKAIESRRLAAREAFIGYLAASQPQAFFGSRESGMSGRRVAQAIAQRQRQTVQRRVERFRQSSTFRDSNENSRTLNQTSSESPDWFMMYVTGNPMWLVSPSIARMQLFVDLMSSPSDRMYHDLTSNLHDGTFDGGGASGDWDRAQQQAVQIEQYMSSHQDVQDFTSTAVQASALDSDLRLGGTMLSDLAPDAASQIDAAIDASVGDSGALDLDRGTDTTAEVNVSADEWNEFVDKSDADWKDDQAPEPQDSNDGPNDEPVS